MIYQNEARGADQLITNAIDAHVQVEQGKDGDEDGPAGILIHASCEAVRNDFRGALDDGGVPPGH